MIKIAKSAENSSKLQVAARAALSQLFDGFLVKNAKNHELRTKIGRSNYNQSNRSSRNMSVVVNFAQAEPELLKTAGNCRLKQIITKTSSKDSLSWTSPLLTFKILLRWLSFGSHLH